MHLTAAHRRAAAALVLAIAIGVTSPAAADPEHPAPDTDAQSAVWDWPVGGVVSRAYQQPADPYSAGHRGIDILADATLVRSPAGGTVLFAGTVVDRPLLTIDHGDGIVSTLEPVTAAVSTGQIVARGDPVGELATGGHARAGELHLGARRDGVYVNPLLLLGDVPRAVLLPCC
jgi:murein DD-endopeptidase MepM/ murein hydrolase activator NlpD